MKIGEFCKKTFKKIKEANDPENIKQRLRNQIEIESLKMEKERIANARRKEKNRSWTIGNISVGEKQ